MAHKILRLPDVLNRTGLSRSTIYLRVSQNSFPKPIALGSRAIGWVESEVDAWLAQQIEKAKQPLSVGVYHE